MAENKKSIIEEALLDADRIQEALQSNAKEILRSVAKEEIDELVKESLNEDDYEEEDVETGDDLDLDDAGEEGEGEELELDDAGEEADEEEEAGEDMTDDYGDEAGMDDMEGSEDYGDEDDSMEYDTMDMTGASDEDVIAVYKKLSGDDEIEVVSDTEVHITDPVSGAEYQVKLGGGEPEGMGDMDEYAESSEPMADEEGMEETVYEVALDEENVSEQEEITEEVGGTAQGKPRTATSDVTMGNDSAAPNTGDIDDQKAPVGNENDDNWAGDNLEGGFDDNGQNGSGDAHADHIMEEEVNEDETVTEEEVNETEEVNEEEVSEEVVEEEDTVEENLAGTRGYAGRQGAKMGGDDHHPSRKDESVKSQETVSESAEQLKKQNEEFRGMLNKFRKMLGETVVFNTNLTNVTRLFTEHSTTREEKEAIIQRFDDSATTIKESKRLYKTIEKELSSKKPISESVENKISKEVSSAQSTAQLNESTAYVDSSTQRIKDLISRVEKPRF